MLVCTLGVNRNKIYKLNITVMFMQFNWIINYVLPNPSGSRAGLYSQELTENCKKIVMESKSSPITDPVEILKRSAAETQSPGSSTILVACFDGQV